MPVTAEVVGYAMVGSVVNFTCCWATPALAAAPNVAVALGMNVSVPRPEPAPALADARVTDAAVMKESPVPSEVA